ncbi:hypothetical protein DCS_08225 [Drechmeria coniospora]|uniref:CN hydrolase domain-containing protein n=1 Tax=Drechmeria coniospora TaxID=98403 RepID=A0A151GGN7_DRECN|nr:hypothetical protein DCS_08225 [Drechmeria coniospora]KYK56255.1 hypothetical protein DCS_08225 [Drechmeria coniospora]
MADLSALARRAASQGIDILLLPEAYIGGYPRGTHFGCVIGDRTEQGREEFARYFDAAVDFGDTVGEGGAGAGARWVKKELSSTAEGVQRGDGTRERLEDIARETGVFVVTGAIEKAGGSMYCAVVYVCPTEGIIGKRRKVMPTGTERLVWAQGSPATLAAVSTTIRGVRVNMAAAICWENYMPLLRQSLYAQNVNLYLAPTADGRDSWLSLMRTVGIEGRCFVVSSNMCVRKPSAASGAVPSQRQRRSSVVEEENGIEIALPCSETLDKRPRCVRDNGFEIALPSHSQEQQKEQQAEGQRGHKLQHRKSVFDEDGNEIVLCCNEDDGESQANGQKTTAAADAKTQANRRKSVFDEDGNEIVLCCKHVDGTAQAANGEAKNRSARSRHGTGRDPSSFVCRGGSSIVSPFGDVLAGPQWDDDDGIIHADVDMRDCVRGRLDLDNAGSYSRNDSFRLTVQGLDLDPLPY